MLMGAKAGFSSFHLKVSLFANLTEIMAIPSTHLSYFDVETWIRSEWTNDLALTTRKLDTLNVILDNSGSNLFRANRIEWMMEEFCLLENMAYYLGDLQKQLGDGVMNAEAEAFLSTCFKLLRTWAVRSRKTRYRMIQGRFFLKSILPFSNLELSMRVRENFAGLALIFLDGACDKFYKCFHGLDVKDAVTSLFRVVYGDRLNPEVFYCGYVDRWLYETRPRRTRIVMDSYGEECWNDLHKRAEKLLVAQKAFAYVSGCKKRNENKVQRKTMLAIMKCDEKISKQKEVEITLAKLALMIRKTKNAQSVHGKGPHLHLVINRVVMDRPTKKRKLEKKWFPGAGIELGNVVVQNLLRFMSVNFNE